jgi:hypothetical protein
MSYALQLFCDGRWGGFCLLTAIWIVYRQRRYASALLARQQQRDLLLVNETWKTAFATVLREQPRRLRDLVEDTESESELKP